MGNEFQRSWMWIAVLVALVIAPSVDGQHAEDPPRAEQEARNEALKQAREELARAQEALAAAEAAAATADEAAAAADEVRRDKATPDVDAAARQAEMLSQQLEQEARQMATQNSARWEAWADGQAQRWEQWAQQYERQWNDWAAGHEAQWEAWAQRYEAQWKDWGRQLETGKIHPDQLREMYRGNLEMLGEMPIQELYQGILENAAELEDAPWEEVAGSIQQLVRESIESAMKGLEAATFEAERDEAQVVDRIRAMQESLQQLNSKLGATQLELDAAARQQLQELKGKLRAVENPDVESMRLRETIEAVREKKTHEERVLLELAMAAKLKQEALKRQSSEIETLREEIRQLRQEIDEQRTKEKPQ